MRRHERSSAAPEGSQVVGREIGVGHHQTDRLDGCAQLFGNRLRERSADVLAYFGLAGINGDGAVFSDVQPSGEFGRAGIATERGTAAGFLRSRGVVESQKQDQPSAEELEKASALDLKEVTPLQFDLRHVGVPQPSEPPQ